MATLSTALNTDFTPAVGDFIAQSWGGTATLTRKNSSGAAAVNCGVINGAVIVSNPIAGAVYQFTTEAPGKVTVQADQ